MCRMARPRKPLLSRDRIVDAARGLIDAEGLAALSTRRLAAELGVSGPSLYNHFRTKDQILEAVADSVSAQVDLSMFEDGRDWRAALHDWAVSYRAALTLHPNIVPVLARGPGRRPAGLRLADAMFGAMVDAGWPPAQATSIGALMRYFIMGSALGSFAGGFVDDETMATALKDMWSQIGVEVTINPLETSVWNEAFSTNAFQTMSISSMSIVNSSPANGWLKSTVTFDSVTSVTVTSMGGPSG